MQRIKTKILDITQEIGTELDDLSFSIYKNPELGNQEVFACSQHVALLKKHGFDVTEGFGGVATGFLAEYTSQKPGITVAFLAEYDALPGIGHGCGHNLLGAMSTGAGIALKNVIGEIGGKVMIFGTPAEETCGAKVIYAEQGAFDGVNIAMMLHPANQNVKSGKSLALEPIEFEFFGKTAHAAACPEDGINALDAVISLFNSVNALRQQVKSSSRIHGVIINGGEAANIIPDYTKAQFYIRSTTKGYNKALLEKVINCAKAAALATGTRMEMNRFEYAYDNLITNQTMSQVLAKHFFDMTGQAMMEPKEDVGSLDAGQVSQICPTIHPYIDITEGIPVAGHSVDMANATVTPFAKRQMRHAIAVMAYTAADIMTNKKLYETIQQEFEGQKAEM